MIRPINKLLLLAGVSVLAACSKGFNPEKYGPYKTIVPLRSDKNIEAPKSLIKMIEGDFLKHYRSVKPTDEISDAKLLVSIPRKYLAFDVFFRHHNNNLAIERPIEINFPRGGGFIDLAQVISGDKGSFYLNILINWQELGLESSDQKNLKVYFVSNSQERDIEGASWGAGCNKYFDLSNYFKNHLSKEGLLLNATDQRYLSALAGTFLFVLNKSGELHLATATFVDNRYKDFMCRS